MRNINGSGEAQYVFANSGHGQFVRFGSTRHGWYGLGVRGMVGTMGCGVWLCERSKLRDVAVFLQPVRNMSVACQAWNSCVLCQAHIVVRMFIVFVYIW